MRKFFKITLISTAVLLAFVACHDNDDNITPSGNYSPIRGGFPQGDSEYDKIINEIKNEYGVYLLYKDVTEEDMNRTWVSAGTGDIYVAGDTLEREKRSWDLPVEHLPYYVDFFRNNIFPNITKEFAHSTFPIKIYMINNLRTKPRDVDDKENGANTTQGTDTNPNKVIKLGEFDNWAISIPDSVISGKNSEYALKQLRCIFMTNVIKNSMGKGEIVAPNEFWVDYSMNRDANCIDGDKHDGCDKVYFDDYEKENGLYTLGYVEVLEEKFGTGNTTKIVKEFPDLKNNPDIKPWFHADYWNPKVNPSWDLFQAYIMNAMWYTPEEFHEKYNTEKHTLIKEKYEFVVNYIKDNYGIDLVGIAYGDNKSNDDN